ncbi:HlyD family efflux transporter periplasmic adaptor subunit [Kushneria indalinina]|uniref:Membrane fusion protein (Multidrug efflux system) n=1 Tax=Kushneria indalinina DSM 14324 TaxID=1122140 RepID=A0A3D9DV01_9GAMM|nr:HlyD family efflux transporter periplasmic adaptor subunit [Kushneria indalinina]REC94603.1 membrane fusion protein (multidrug efflux system) [Kushneria indalinina DSM 14324]
MATETDHTADAGQPPAEGDYPEAPVSRKKRNIILLVIALVFALAGIGWYLLDTLVLSTRVITDDAYVQGDQVNVSAQINATVTAINVEDTEPVKRGQVLITLDDSDTRNALDQAAGQLAQAVRRYRQQRAQAVQLDAATVTARAQFERARDEYQRRKPLLAQRAASKEEVDSARRQFNAAQAQLEQAQAQARAAHALIDGNDVWHDPGVLQARAAYRNAWLAQQRTQVIAPVDGFVASRQVQLGQSVQAGQPLLTVVPLHDLWVEANFKETQLGRVRIGQAATVTTDFYGSDVVYHGHVAGLSAGTGAAFSLLPAQNATGNWIKVVQRVPVRITLDDDTLESHPLRMGLSTYTRIELNDNADGPMLAEAPRVRPPQHTEVFEARQQQADAAAMAIIRDNAGELLTDAADSATP